MKILLIAPNSRKKFNVKEPPLITPPINLMYLAEVIRRNDYDVKILDAFALNLDCLEVLKAVNKFKPDVVLIPLYSNDLLTVHNLVCELKTQNPDIIITLGSHHASNMPDAVLAEFDYVDYVLRGEAEQSVIGLLKCISKNGKGLSNVKGLSYRKGKNRRIVHNPSQPLIQDLDSVPIPSRDLINSKDYYSKLFKRNPLDIIITSRGCPLSCSFCSKIDKNFNFYRMRSPENVIEELREILNHGAKSIEIYDEFFSANKKRCLKITKLIKKEKMDFEFRIRTRIDSVDAELLRALESINCTIISYGVESGNQKILDLNGKGLRLKQVEKAFNLIRKTEIKALGFFLIGFPQDTPKTIEDTINFAKKLNPRYAIFTRIRPFPGTRVYIEAKRDHTLVEDWSIYKGIPWIKLPWAKSLEDVERYSRRAYHEFYYRPKFVFDFFKGTIEKKNWSQLAYISKYSLKDLRLINLEP